MEIRLYLQMLLRNWWIILLAGLVAVVASLGVSYMAVPQYEAVGRFIINPSASITASADVVRSLDTLDRPSVAATYVEVMNSQRIFSEAVASLGVDPKDPSLSAYVVQAVVLPSSSVLQLTVTGPNPAVVAELVNTIGSQSINYARRVNSVYNLEFLDSASAPTTPISPVPLRDAGLSLILGLFGGAFLAILSEQIRMPIESLRRRTFVDPVSSAYTRKYFYEKLEEELLGNKTGNVALGLIQLEGLTGLVETLPSILSQQLLQEAARRLRGELRGNDIVGRWGATEFVVMLPSTPDVAAERTLDRIRQALSQPILIGQTRESVLLNPFTAVVVSKPQEQASSVINRAEEALIQSRRSQFITASAQPLN